MTLKANMRFSLLVLLVWILRAARPEATAGGSHSRQVNGNVSFPKSNFNSGGLSSFFSPRMDFDRWKPLTGRGDPLRNDPTYDYEPPVLERVHYWADDSRLEREKHPDRKSEVLVLGVSSRKPSVVSRPPMPPRRSPRPPPPTPAIYEDYSYKLSNDYPMTILVPPPPPPPGHKPLLFIIPNENAPPSTTPIYVESTLVTKDVTPSVDLITSYALQEANLIYQSSTKQDWYENYNKSNIFPNIAVSSDYAGWGPTTPFDDTIVNDTNNLIPHVDHNIQISEHKYSLHRPMFSDAPPPLLMTSNALPPFLPTVLPPTTNKLPQESYSVDNKTYPDSEPEPATETYNSVEQILQTTTEHSEIPSRNSIYLQTTPAPQRKHKPTMVDMLAPMMTMPMITDLDRPEDNYYAHPSENIHIFKEPFHKDDFEAQVMQTMQPPPIQFESSTSSYEQALTENPHKSNSIYHDKPVMPTHDPYLHMRFTTRPPSTTTTEVLSQDIKSTTEKIPVPTYLIIQGHSKVKTYGSKPKSPQITVNNDLPNQTNEVKHLHPIKEKKKATDVKGLSRGGRSKNLKSLIDKGVGSIEIQEADVGIKYDISDGSDVPVEIYKKGIVDNEENNYRLVKKSNSDKRTKRQIDLESLLPFDEDSLEEFVYNFFDNRQNDTGIIGLISKTITNEKVSSVVDNLENDDDEDDDESEDR